MSDNSDSAEEELPACWKANFVATENARAIFDKFAKRSDKLSKQGFDKLCLAVQGTSAASKSSKDRRAAAWLAHRNPDCDTVKFPEYLSVVTACCIPPKLFIDRYRSVMNPSPAKRETPCCPFCDESLPDDLFLARPVEVVEDDDELEQRQILKKLADVQRRRASHEEDARKMGIVLNKLDFNRLAPLNTSPRPFWTAAGDHSAPGSGSCSPRFDPRLSRLPVDERDRVADALEKLLSLGFTEIGDLRALLAHVKRLEPQASTTPQSLSARGSAAESLADQDDLVQTLHRTATVNTSPTVVRQPSAPSPPKRRTTSSTPRGGPSHGYSPCVPSLPRRKSAAAVSPTSPRGAPQAMAPRRRSTTNRTSAGSELPRMPSSGTLRTLRNTGASYNDFTANVPPPPDPLPLPLALPAGLLKKESLQPALFRRTEKLIESVKRNDGKAVKQWIEAGKGGINVHVDDSTTLAHIAVMSRNRSSFEILKMVATPQSLAAWNEYGETPLHVAARCCSPDKIRALYDLSAGMNAVDARGDTALHVASRALAGAATVQALLECGSSAVEMNDKKQGPAHVAATPEVVAVLLAHFKQVGGLVPSFITARDEEGNTPLHDLVTNGIFESCAEHPVLQQLCEAADVNAQNYMADTPLHAALERSDLDVAETLTLLGADVHTQNAKLLDPMTIAKRHWQQEAGCRAQLPWSGLLAAWGMSVVGMSGSKGSAWHVKESFGWVVPEGGDDTQNLLGQLHGQLARSADKKVQYPDEEGSLYSKRILSLFHPEKASWAVLTATVPKTLAPCSRIRIACQLQSAETVEFNIRLLPVVS